MSRSWAIAALAFLAATGFTQGGGKEKDKDKDFQAKGTFTKDDPVDAQRGGPSQVHAVRMKAGKVYTIDMVSNQVAPFLRLQDSKGTELLEDDSMGMPKASIVFNCTTDGEYKIVCTTIVANMFGAYTLTVKNTGTVQAMSAAHAKLIGNAAPDFAADFAVNGKARKLSALKGKIVLLYFWEVRSTSSAAYLPRFAEWNKAYKANGLAIVGATFYATDIGQKLGFDAESGAVVTADKADKKSDQALLQAFAKHRKVDHLLLALPKQTALDAFDAYAVNGLPQVVLIDRKGMVRVIDVGGEKTSAYVESELKKLLADK